MLKTIVSNKPPRSIQKSQCPNNKKSTLDRVCFEQIRSNIAALLHKVVRMDYMGHLSTHGHGLSLSDRYVTLQNSG